MDQQRNDDRLHVNETAIFYYIIIMVILNVSQGPLLRQWVEISAQPIGLMWCLKFRFDIPSSLSSIPSVIIIIIMSLCISCILWEWKKKCSSVIYVFSVTTGLGIWVKSPPRRGKKMKSKFLRLFCSPSAHEFVVVWFRLCDSEIGTSAQTNEMLYVFNLCSVKERLEIKPDPHVVVRWKTIISTLHWAYEKKEKNVNWNVVEVWLW